VNPVAWRATLALAGLLALTGCSAQDAPLPCGWDLTTDAGRQANADRLDEVTAWIATRAGEPVPEPTSSFWHGECPQTSTPEPPVHEGHDEGEDDLR